MTEIMSVSGLSDAHVLLNNAKGMPTTPNGKMLIDTLVRASVIFSWMAFEEVVRHELQSRKLKTPPTRLWDRVTMLLANRVVPDFARFDASKRTFLARRAVRNGIAHSLSTADVVSLRDAEDAFEYCKAGVQAITGVLYGDMFPRGGR